MPQNQLAGESELTNHDLIIRNLGILVERIRKHGRRQVRLLADMIQEKCLTRGSLICEVLK